jgi:nucleoside-diphosphate-sugar epimerase
MRVAILGATSHVAKNLIAYLPEELELVLFARKPERIAAFLLEGDIGRASASAYALEYFNEYREDLDAVINCVGFGTPEKVRSGGAEIFQLTEKLDEMVLGHLGKKPKTRYVNFSSGVLYEFVRNAEDSKKNEFRVDLDSLSESDAYRIAKLNSEAKHRAMKDYYIFDLRLFSFFTRYIDLNSSYLVTEMLRAIKENKVFETDNRDIIRDYIHPRDLARFVMLCMSVEERNCALDLYSLEAVRKSEIIKCFKDRFHLRVRKSETPTAASPTRDKLKYVSTNHSAEQILGYEPRYTSLECLIEEADAIVRAG